MLAALPLIPENVIVGDAYVITQGTGPSSINDTLVNALSSEPWAGTVSPEILALGTIAGQAVLTRGADPLAFVAIEGGQWLEPGDASDGYAFAGEGLARRLDLTSGSFVSLVGSMLPRIEVVRISGIFRTSTVANDEFVVDMDRARFLTGVGLSQYHTIRLEASAPDSLLAFLEARGASVHVTGPGILRADILTDPPASDRLANLLLRTGQGTIPRDLIATALDDATASVRVVTLGTALLIGLLVALGIDAVQARAFEDRRAAVGILRALGSSNAWIRRRMVRETVPFALGAAALGVSLGFVVQYVFRPTALLVVFGHSVTSVLDVGTFVAITGAVAAVSVLSSLLLLGSALRRRPSELIQERPAYEPRASLEVVVRG